MKLQETIRNQRMFINERRSNGEKNLPSASTEWYRRGRPARDSSPGPRIPWRGLWLRTL